MSRIITSDTDELDDADLGINVDSKEYHKQKNKQLSLINKLNSLQQYLDKIKQSINNETSEYNKELIAYAKKLNKNNRREWKIDNKGDDWLTYSGKITEKILCNAYIDGVFKDIELRKSRKKPDKKELISSFINSSIYKKLKSILDGKSVLIYRGISLKDTESGTLKYVKYNLMDRNSWSTDLEKATDYAFRASFEEGGILAVLEMKCSIKQANLPLSAWLAGFWRRADNKEINLKKSFDVEDINIHTLCVDKKQKENFKELLKTNNIKCRHLIVASCNIINNTGDLMNKYTYRGEIITASSKEEAIHKIVAEYRPKNKYGNLTSEDIKKSLKTYSPIEKDAVGNYRRYKKEIEQRMNTEGIHWKAVGYSKKFDAYCKLCYEAEISSYDAFKYISTHLD